MLFRNNARYFLVLSAFARTITATCYAVDGEKITNPEYQPCNLTNGSLSMCCGTNRQANPGDKVDPNDICLPSGLCEYEQQLDNGRLETTFWRNSCSTSDWSSPACLNICRDSQLAQKDLNVQVTPCGDAKNTTRWCCGPSSECCSQWESHPNAVSIAQDLSQTSSITSDLSIPSVDNTASPRNSISRLSASEKGLIGFGVTVAIAGLFSLVSVILRVYRRCKYERAIYSSRTLQFGVDEKSQLPYIYGSPAEMESVTRSHEFSNEARPANLAVYERAYIRP